MVVSPERTYGQFTLETLLATAFGRKINVQMGESDDLVEVLLGFLGRNTKGQGQSAAPRVSTDDIVVILSKQAFVIYDV